MKRNVLSALGARTQPPPISWLMQLALSRPRLISLAAGFTDNESLPVREVQKLLERILVSRSKGESALQYGSTQGDPALRRLTADYLHQLDRNPKSSNYAPDRMIISNGSQQMLYLVTEALCDTGDIVLLEDPTYFVYLGILQSRGVEARGIRMERDGLNIEQLESVLQSLKKTGDLRRVKAVYLVSYFQNPTAITTSFRKKQAALELLRRYERAAGHPIFLIEDAAYRELRFRGDDERSALAVRGAGDRVIYAGTYSKPFATGTRVGFGMLPEPLFRAVLSIKGNHDFGTSNLLQQLMTQALQTSQYQDHLRGMRRRYARKAGVMSQILQETFPPDVEWIEPDGGLYFWAKLPKHIRCGTASALFKSALASEVLYVPGELCYADDPTRKKVNHEMRISFGNASEKDIREGVRRLGSVLARAIKAR
jgi:2-aminoadipate transaminase